MSVLLRSWFNRVRRAVGRGLLFRIVFGERALDGRMLGTTRISPSTCIEHSDRLTLGDDVFIGHFNLIEASHGVRIDDGVQITNFVSIVSHSSHRAQRLMGRHSGMLPFDRQPGFVAGPVHIGPFCYIGPHCVIEANTQLGRGCIVASHSRVRGSFPDFSAIAGAPAQVVGDTREGDRPLLDAHPEWRATYEAWAGSAGGPVSAREN
jgi:acetyltransferase-like isoleucine patch superfamily enzyme